MARARQSGQLDQQDYEAPRLVRAGSSRSRPPRSPRRTWPCGLVWRSSRVGTRLTDSWLLETIRSRCLELLGARRVRSVVARNLARCPRPASRLPTPDAGCTARPGDRRCGRDTLLAAGGQRNHSARQGPHPCCGVLDQEAVRHRLIAIELPAEPVDLPHGLITKAALIEAAPPYISRWTRTTVTYSSACLPPMDLALAWRLPLPKEQQCLMT